MSLSVDDRLLCNNSPDDGHMAARSMKRIEINIHEKLCVNLIIYKDHTRLYRQQNIKNVLLHVCYIFRPIRRPFSGMSVQKSYEGSVNKMEFF